MAALDCYIAHMKYANHLLFDALGIEKLIVESRYSLPPHLFSGKIRIDILPCSMYQHGDHLFREEGGDQIDGGWHADIEGASTMQIDARSYRVVFDPLSGL